MISVGPTGFLKKPDVLETDPARGGDVRPRDSPLTFYSDRQLGIELESNAGRQAGGGFAECSRVFPSPLHQPVGFVSEREYVFPDPGRQSNVGGTAPSSEQARTHSLRRPNEPSSNNGVSPFGQGDVNGERDEVLRETYGPPSNGEYFVGSEFQRAELRSNDRAIPTTSFGDVDSALLGLLSVSEIYGLKTETSFKI